VKADLQIDSLPADEWGRSTNGGGNGISNRGQGRTDGNRHPDGRWVTLRKATDQDISAMNRAVSKQFHDGYGS
jgi:hypothetical protein